MHSRLIEQRTTFVQSIVRSTASYRLDLSSQYACEISNPHLCIKTYRIFQTVVPACIRIIVVVTVFSQKSDAPPFYVSQTASEDYLSIHRDNFADGLCNYM